MVHVVNKFNATNHINQFFRGNLSIWTKLVWEGVLEMQVKVEKNRSLSHKNKIFGKSVSINYTIFFIRIKY